MGLHKMLGIKKSNKRNTVTITGTYEEFKILFGQEGEKAYIMAAFDDNKLDIDGAVIHKIKTSIIL